MWVSEPLGAATPEWLELTWPEHNLVTEIQVIFDDDVHQDLNNLHLARIPFDVVPTLVRDYRIDAWVDGDWVVLAHESSNRRRRRVTRLGTAITTDRIRIVVEATNGSPRAHIVSVRAYGGLV